MHAHKCEKCGTIFYHSNEMRGSVAAHRCPACGESQWAQYTPENAKLPNFEVPIIRTSSAALLTVNEVLHTATWILMFVAAGCIAYQTIKNIRTAGISVVSA